MRPPSAKPGGGRGSLVVYRRQHVRPEASPSGVRPRRAAPRWLSPLDAILMSWTCAYPLAATLGEGESERGNHGRQRSVDRPVRYIARAFRVDPWCRRESANARTTSEAHRFRDRRPSSSGRTLQRVSWADRGQERVPARSAKRCPRRYQPAQHRAAECGVEPLVPTDHRRPVRHADATRRAVNERRSRHSQALDRRRRRVARRARE